MWDLMIGVVSGHAPVLSADVEIVDGPNEGVSGLTDAAGVVTLTGLQQSGFTVCATAEGFERGCAGVTLTASQAVTINVAATGPKPLPPPDPLAFAGPISVRGVQFVDARGDVFRPVFASGLTLLVRSDAERAAFLDWCVRHGFNGVRVFAGHLAWAGQTVEGARLLLPSLLEEAKARGLVVMVTAITDSRPGGYDVADHLRRVSKIVANFDNVLLEAGNEPYHGTQADVVQNFDVFCDLARRALDGYARPWALGAAPFDGLLNGRYLGACGTFSTVHIKRTRNADEQIERMRYQLRAIARASKHPAMNSEPTGAAEKADGSARFSNPAFFGEMGSINRSADVGGGVFHFEDGLHARTPIGPVQQKAAEAFVAGNAREPVALPGGTLQTSCAAVSRTDPKAILECNRYRFARMSYARVGEMLDLTVRDLNAAGIPGPWGVLLKSGGNNCPTPDGKAISCDVLCIGNGDEQRQFDVLTGSDPDGVQQPSWHELQRPNMTIRTCEVRR